MTARGGIWLGQNGGALLDTYQAQELLARLASHGGSCTPLREQSELKVTGQLKVTRVWKSKPGCFYLSVLSSRGSNPDPRRATACPEPLPSHGDDYENHTDAPGPPSPGCHTCPRTLEMCPSIEDFSSQSACAWHPKE